MNNLVQIFSTNIFPIFITALAGWLLGNIFSIDTKSLARVAFYIFSPALVFQLIINNNIPSLDSARMVFLALATTSLIALLVWIIAKKIGFSRQMTAAMMLVSVLPNAGNFGLSLNYFAIGEQGLAQASIYFVTMGTITYTFGVVVASMGKESFTSSLKRLFKIPILYALMLAFAFNTYGIALPIPINRSIELLSQAAIPTMLILLGMQLRSVNWNDYLAPLALVATFRLVISPLIAYVLSLAIAMKDIPLDAAVLEAAMPSAVMTIILATEFDTEPEFVTTAVTATTLLSPLTLTPLLALLI